MAASYRSVMEVLKFTEPKTVLATAATMSSLWSHIADSDELWLAYLEAEELETLANLDLPSNKARYREVSIGKRTECFVLVVAQKVRVYRSTTGRCLRQLECSSAIFLQFSAIAILSNTELFVCGGMNRNAYLYSLVDGAIKPLPDMFEARNRHSALYCYRRVYVFGSERTPVSKTAESFGLKEIAWQRLPDMLTQRGSFNACNEGVRIYLCGGNTVACEVFHIPTMQYTTLGFSLPEADWTVSFFYQKQLVSIVHPHAYFLEKYGWRKTKLLIGFIPLGSSAAVVHDSFVYIPMNSIPRVLKVDMDTRKCGDFM